jgi:hypothetical protein
MCLIWRIGAQAGKILAMGASDLLLFLSVSRNSDGLSPPFPLMISSPPSADWLRAVARASGTSPVAVLSRLLLGPLADRDRPGTRHTLLAVCPNSEAVARAALRAAQEAGTPLLYAATLNQVDRDGGYTGWTNA